jgi:hypothetical protein
MKHATRTVLETLDRTKLYRKYEPIEEPRVVVSPPTYPVINWTERKMTKNKLFLRYLLIMAGSTLALTLLLVIPTWLVSPAHGKGFLMGLPPMLCLALSWMVGAWWAWDKARHLFIGCTVCMTPMRMGIGLVWASMVLQLPGLDASAFVLGMMVYWVVYTTIEIAMIQHFSKKVGFTPELEPQE